jgi:hypothetical protein
VTRAELAQQLWTDAQSSAHLQRRLRAAYRGRHDVLDALWWRAHPSTRSPSGQPDPASTLPEALAEVYSRHSTTEPLLEFLDPVSNHMVRATEADRVLRTLTLDLARDAAALDEFFTEFEESAKTEPFAQNGASEKNRLAVARDGAALASTAFLRRRHPGFVRAAVQQRGTAYFVVAGAVVGAAATAVFIGIAHDLTGGPSPTTSGTASGMTSGPVADTPSPSPNADPNHGARGAVAPADPFQIFTERSEYETGIDPLLGSGFVPLDIRRLPDAGAASAGFRMFAAQRADGDYCLILQHPDNTIGVVCATPETITRRGLRLEAIVIPDAPGDTYPQPFEPVDVSIVWDRSGEFTTQFEPRF